MKIMDKRCVNAVVKEVLHMHITKTKKALIAVTALVLVGLIVAVAAICLPGAGSTLPTMDNTVADSGSGADTVSTVSASATAPLEDGKVADQQTSVPEGWTGVYSDTDWSTVRGQSGNFILMENITLSSLDTSGGTFSGTFDGNGYTITIDADSSSSTENVGGLFSQLSGTVKNLRVKVTKFRNFLYSGVSTSCTGMIAGLSSGNVATVDNVYIQLLYGPSSISGNDSDEGYIVSQERPSGMYNIMGGVIGKATGTTEIKNTTVDVATDGYGFVAVARFKKGISNLTPNTANAFVGGFVGEMNGDSLYFENITLTDTSENGTGIIQAYSTSTSSRKMNAYVGGIVGYLNEGTFSGIDGLIFNFKAVHHTNIKQTNAGSGDYKIGVMFGTYDSYQSPQTFKSIYLINDSANAYIAGNNETAFTGLIRYADTYTPRFDDDGNIVFYCAKKYAPNSADLLTTFINGSKQVNVMTALMLNDGEDGELTYWLSVPKSGDGSAGSDTSVGFADTKATQSTISTDESAYVSSREYDGELPVGPSANGKAYVCDNVSKNIGSYIFKFDKTPYQVIEYGGTEYYVDLNEDGSTGTTVYSPAEGFDPAKEYIVEITQREITLGNLSGNITYGDDLATVQLNNIPGATAGSIVSNEYVEFCTISDYVQLETNAGNEEAFNYTSVVIKDADGADVTGNYAITYGAGKAVVKQKTIAGTLTVDSLTYSTTEKVAVFTLTDGALYNGDSVMVSYDEGDRTNVTEAGFIATATVPNGNYTFGGESGASVSQNFIITPYEITITAKEDRPTAHVYNSGVVSVDDLFNIPVGLGGDGELALSLSATKDSVEAAIELVGEYTVTASLAEGQDNYTADPVSVDYTVTPYIVEIGVNEEIEKSMVYDGAALTTSEMQALFVAPQQVEGAEADLTISVEGGVSVLNAGTYKITATILDEDLDLTRYALKEDVTVEFTVEQATVDGEITAPENSVYDGSEKFATFEFAEGYGMFGDDEVILSYATQGGQGVSQVVSAGTYTVSAVLPAFAAGKSNYKWASEEIATKDIVISKAPVTIDKAVDVTADYSGVAFTDYESLFTAPEGVNKEGALTLSYSVTKGEEAVEGSIVNAGTYTVTATLADNGTNANYEASAASVTYKINKLAVSVVADDASFTYGGEIPELTWSYAENSAQFVEADAITLAVATDATVQSPANGIYKTYIENQDTEFDNYTVSYADGVMTVNKATPAVTANVTIPDGGLFTSSEMPEITADFGENTVVAGNIAWDAEQSLTAGENEYAWTFTPEDTANYNAVTGKTTLNVQDVLLDRIEIVSQPSKATYEYGDKFDKTGMVVEAVYNDGSRESVEDYTVADAYLTTLSENLITVTYNEKTAVVTVNVVAKAFELAYSDLTVVVGTENFDIASITASIVGTEGGKVTVAGTEYDYTVTVAYTDEGNVYSSEAAVGATYPLTATLAITGLDLANYQSAYSAELTVISEPIEGSWTSVPSGAVYNGQPHAAVFTATNAEEGAYTIQYALEGTDDWSDVAPVNAGIYVAKVVSANEEQQSAAKIETVTFEIAKAQVTVTWPGASSVMFSGAAYEPTFEATGLVGEDKISLAYEASVGALTDGKARNAGSYTATAVQPSDNYAFASGVQQSFAFTIETVKISVTYVGSNVNVEYGTAYDWNIEDFYKNPTANSDDFTVEFGFDIADDLSDIATADKDSVFNALLAITVKDSYGLPIDDADAANFEVVNGEEYSIDLTVTVIAKKITVTAENASAVYDGEKVEKSELLATFGLTDGTGIELEVNGVAYDGAEIVNVGEYSVTVEAANANYEVYGEKSATFGVLAKALTVVWGELTLEYDGTAKVPTATADTGIDGESITLAVSGAATEPGSYTATATTDNGNYTLTGATAEFTIVRSEVVAQFTVGYGEITVNVEGDGEVEYSVDGGAWTALPGNGKITVNPAASWTVSLRFKGETKVVSSVVYTSAGNVVTYLENNLSDNVIENKEAIDTAKAWLATASGDKSDATAKIEAAEKAYNAAKDELSASVENAFKATANMTSRAVAATVAIVTAVSGLGLAVGAIALRRKGGKKNEK